MSINIGPASSDDMRPKIMVVGVGGAGGNAIANMIDSEANSNGMHGFGFDWTVRTGGAGNTLFSPASKKDKLSQSG